MPTPDRRRAVLQELIADCAIDAAALDSTPFTPRGVATALGQMLAQIEAVATVTLTLLPEEEAHG